jgi:hypothetical protein
MSNLEQVEYEAPERTENEKIVPPLSKFEIKARRLMRFYPSPWGPSHAVDGLCSLEA